MTVFLDCTIISLAKRSLSCIYTSPYTQCNLYSDNIETRNIQFKLGVGTSPNSQLEFSSQLKLYYLSYTTLGFRDGCSRSLNSYPN